MPEVIRPFALRRGTAAAWTAANTVLLEGQEGYETDTRKRKVGARDVNGVLIPWNSLPYDVAESGLTSVTTADITDFDTAVDAKVDASASLLSQDIEQASRGDIVYRYNGNTTGIRFDLAEGNFDNGIGARFYKGGPEGAVEAQTGHIPRFGDWHLAVPLTAPLKVTGLNVTSATATAVSLAWNAPFDGGSPITDYVVEYSADGGTTWTVFADGTSTVAATTVTGLVDSTTYSFRVAAVNSLGTGTYSDVVAGSTDSAPAQVTGLTGTAASTSVALTWTAPADGGSAITDYIVEFRTGTAAFAVFADGTSTTTSATVTGLTASTTYDFRVSAVNAVGTGPASAIYTVATTA